MEVWAERAYHYEKPVREQKKTRETPGRQKMIEMTPEEMTWKSLINNGLCMGMQSLCVIGKCDVMCAYGRRYIREKDQHAG